MFGEIVETVSVFEVREGDRQAVWVAVVVEGRVAGRSCERQYRLTVTTNVSMPGSGSAICPTQNTAPRIYENIWYLDTLTHCMIPRVKLKAGGGKNIESNVYAETYEGNCTCETYIHVF